MTALGAEVLVPLKEGISVTALGAEVLVPLKEGIGSSLSWPPGQGGRPWLNPEQAPAAPRGRILAGCLCCFYGFVIFPVRKCEGPALAAIC